MSLYGLFAPVSFLIALSLAVWIALGITPEQQWALVQAVRS